MARWQLGLDELIKHCLLALRETLSSGTDLTSQNVAVGYCGLGTRAQARAPAPLARRALPPASRAATPASPCSRCCCCCFVACADGGFTILEDETITPYVDAVKAEAGDAAPAAAMETEGGAAPAEGGMAAGGEAPMDTE